MKFTIRNSESRRRRSSILLWMERLWREETTVAGRMLAVAIIIVGTAASVSLDNPIYQLLVALSFVALLDFVVAWLLRPRIALEWRPPEKAVADEPFELSCMIENQSRFAARQLSVAAEQLPYGLQAGGTPTLEALAPGESARMTLPILPARRGSYLLPGPAVYSLSPFMLFRTKARFGRSDKGRYRNIPLNPPSKGDFRRRFCRLLHAIGLPIRLLSVPSSKGGFEGVASGEGQSQRKFPRFSSALFSRIPGTEVGELAHTSSPRPGLQSPPLSRDPTEVDAEHLDQVHNPNSAVKVVLPKGDLGGCTRGASGILSSTRLLVYPRFRRLRAIDVPTNARYQPGGVALSSSVGESPEYIGNREYRAGDSLRHLDHRSWARLGVPVVREYQEEYYCRVALVLDTFVPGRRPPGPEGFPQLEAAVSLAAAIADVLSRTEYIIDIFAAGPELYVFRAGRHTAHFENVLEILACVDACRTNPFQKVTPALMEELGNISSLIGVFLDWDADRLRLLRAAAEAGCAIKAAVVREGATTLDLGGAELAYPIAHYTPDAVRSGRIEVL